MEKTIYAFKMILKAALMLLCESNTEAGWINKSIAKWINNPLWQWHWLSYAKLAETQSKVFMELADKIN